MKTHYETLGVSRNATEEEIKKSYKTLAKHYHPDKNFGNAEEATEKFKSIQAAYEILKDERKRLAYDNFLEAMEKKKQKTTPSQSADYKKTASYEGETYKKNAHEKNRPEQKKKPDRRQENNTFDRNVFQALLLVILHLQKNVLGKQSEPITKGKKYSEQQNKFRAGMNTEEDKAHCFLGNQAIQRLLLTSLTHMAQKSRQTAFPALPIMTVALTYLDQNGNRREELHVSDLNTGTQVGLRAVYGPEGKCVNMSAYNLNTGERSSMLTVYDKQGNPVKKHASNLNTGERMGVHAASSVPKVANNREANNEANKGTPPHFRAARP